MPAALVRSNVDVLDHEGVRHRRVTIELLAGSTTAKVVSRQGAVLAQLDGAGEHTSPRSRTWVIPFESGETWTVTARSGCNCGGRV